MDNNQKEIYTKNNLIKQHIWVRLKKIFINWFLLLGCDLTCGSIALVSSISIVALQYYYPKLSEWVVSS